MRWWDGCDAVRCGFWVNFSSGTVNGSTLTLPSQWGLILTAFVALFIKLVGGYLWGIVCFALHQSSASASPEDDMHHQFQVIKRNTEHETSFIWKIHKVALAHKGARFEVYRRCMWLILLAILHGLSFSVAGGLSSYFMVSTTEVQVVPGQCGWIKEVAFNNLVDDAAFNTANALIVTARNGFRRSATYSRSCYAHAEGNTACGTYVQAALPYQTTLNAPCPFDEKICNARGIHLETGPLRSDEHLGINTRPEDTMSLRKQLTCAPLAGEKYTDGWIVVNSSLPLNKPATEAIGYKFGKTPRTAAVGDYTFAIKKAFIEMGDLRYNLGSLSSFQNYSGDKASLFDPIPELASSDADLSLITLINRALYRNPVVDPWINAQNCTIRNDVEINGTRLCEASNPVSFMGCQERYQFCTSDGKSCTPLTGLYALQQGLEALNPTQGALYQVLWKIAWYAQLNLQIGLAGQENLIANEYLWDNSFSLGLSENLPSDHWQQEVANWMNTSLAVMQRAAISFARPAEFGAGPGLSSLKYISGPEDPAMQLLCHKVKMRSTEFTSFSVLGLFLILSLGLLIMAANGFVPILVGMWQRRTGQGGYKRLEWVESSNFQLQRMAAEGRGIGPWDLKDADVPRLVERGVRFNLMTASLRGGGGIGGLYTAYQGVARGENSPQPGGIQLVNFDDTKSGRLS